MFEHIVLRRSDEGQPITAGKICESLLFYQKAHLVLDFQSVLGLVKQIGPQATLRLLRRPDVSGVFVEEALSVRTIVQSGTPSYQFACILSTADAARSQPYKGPEERLAANLERSGIEPKVARSFPAPFLRTVALRRFHGNHFVAGGIPRAAHTAFADDEFVPRALREIVRNLPGGYDPGDDLRAEVIQTELGNFLFDNVDLEAINSRRASTRPPLEPFTTGDMLVGILDAVADLTMAAHYGGDFVTSAVNSNIIRLRHELLLTRAQINRGQKQEFLEIALKDMPTIAEVIDSGERSVDDFLGLLHRANRFKSWVLSANSDEGLTREYLRSLTAEDWLQTSKAKTLRYIFTTAIDQGTGFAASFAAGLVDNFILDKLLGGWKPNHFIDSRLRPFLTPV
jgi:hypothetical protein